MPPKFNFKKNVDNQNNNPPAQPQDQQPQQQDQQPAANNNNDPPKKGIGFGNKFMKGNNQNNNPPANNNDNNNNPPANNNNNNNNPPANNNNNNANPPPPNNNPPPPPPPPNNPPGGLGLTKFQPKPLADTKKLGEILQEWNEMVRKQRSTFERHAKKVIDWDTELRKARVDLLRIQLEVNELTHIQDIMDNDLNNIEKQQQSMEDTLNTIEKFIDDEIMGGNKKWDDFTTGNQKGTSAQRSRAEAYNIALQIDTLLDNYDRDLQTVDDAVSNALNEQNNDPLSKVKLMLNDEMNALHEVELKSNHIITKARELKSLANKLESNLQKSGR